jgi:hypothetical protein
MANPPPHFRSPDGKEVDPAPEAGSGKSPVNNNPPF